MRLRSLPFRVIRRIALFSDPSPENKIKWVCREKVGLIEALGILVISPFVGLIIRPLLFLNNRLSLRNPDAVES